jgi:16S rRNA C1402 N4-methylase RsmH
MYTFETFSEAFLPPSFSMIRHQPVLAAEIFANLPTNFCTYFDGTFGHGGHVEYLLSHIAGKLPHVIACDLDEAILQKGLAFTTQRTHHITPLWDTYAHIAQI